MPPTHMTWMVRIGTALIACGAAAAAEPTVRVALTTGGAEVGVVVGETPEAITLRVTIAGAKGLVGSVDRVIPRARISSMATVVTAQDEYSTKVASIPATAAAQTDFARWCQAHGLPAQAEKHARQAWQTLPGFAPAAEVLTALGCLLDQGTWLSPAAAQAKLHMVTLHGAVVTAEEAANQHAAAMERQRRAALQNDLADYAGRERKTQDAIDELQRHNASQTAEIDHARTYLHDHLLRVAQLEDAIRSAKATYDQDDAERVREENVNGRGNALPGTYQAERAALDALKAAKAAYDGLIANLTAAKASLDRASHARETTASDIAYQEKMLAGIQAHLSDSKAQLQPPSALAPNGPGPTGDPPPAPRAARADLPGPVETAADTDTVMRGTIADRLTAIPAGAKPIMAAGGQTTEPAVAGIAMLPVISSAIRAIGYDVITSTLEIEFASRAHYQYRKVPLEQVDALRGSPSIGTYFDAEIKPRYAGTRSDPGTESATATPVPHRTIAEVFAEAGAKSSWDRMVLMAHDGTFLGTLDPGKSADSIFNPLGEHGSSWSLTAITNPNSQYGGAYWPSSARNPNATEPPLLYEDGRAICRITANPFTEQPAITFEEMIALVALAAGAP